MIEHDGKAKCPYCYSSNQKHGYMHGNGSSDACVIKCQKCGKDFFSEARPGSCNYKIDMEDGSVDRERLERLKNDYGYAT